ncbi:diaminopimelate epimerase [Eikenella corrodens]|uniref:Diaminopimelate epimerase n=1 Tax=Eikenella corrodens TaxID=539 RepID=A0A3S9SLB8_EIKCO|nr:diaminopimelate epimerase [Eikenella corrodens]AZR60317.1 diaminopimelate epimerase [Eikenella corrodens]
MAVLKFTKMHGLGNDFMVIDGISQHFDPATAPIAEWADRHRGIGFDQLLLVEAPPLPEAEFGYRIFNADGSEVEQCGNGARCFARFVHEKGLSRNRRIKVATAKGLIVLNLQGNGLVTVDMGEPRLAATDIPFAPAPGEASDALWHEIDLDGASARFSCVNMGNPHAVLVVDDVRRAPVAEWSARLERHPQFPERVNVGFMQVLDAHHIRLRVFERGTGETQACGTGACAAAVAGMRAGLLARQGAVCVSLPGGDLQIEWAADNHVLMSGPAATVFEGTVTY